MADAPPPYNPGYANEKLQMAPGGPEVVPGTQPPPQHYPQPQQPPQHYPPPAGGHQPYPQAVGGQQPYPQAVGGQQPYPQAVAGQQPYQPPPGNPQYPADQKGYPPPANYPPPGAQPYPGQPPVTGSHTVIIQQPQVVGAVRYGPSPVTITCPSCSKLVTTGTQSQCCSSFPWLICGIICLVGLVTGGITWLGCCLIPFCIPDLYDVNHSCPNCNSQVGHYSKMS